MSTTTIQISPPAELREIDFSKLQVITAIPEGERYAHAASMDLPTLGRFIQPALNCAKALVEAYRPYVQNFLERTAHQGKQKLLTDDCGKQVTRDELCKQTIGVGIRRLNQLLRVTDPDVPKPTKGKKKLTETLPKVGDIITEQIEVLDEDNQSTGTFETKNFEVVDAMTVDEAFGLDWVIDCPRKDQLAMGLKAGDVELIFHVRETDKVITDPTPRPPVVSSREYKVKLAELQRQIEEMEGSQRVLRNQIFCNSRLIDFVNLIPLESLSKAWRHASAVYGGLNGTGDATKQTRLNELWSQIESLMKERGHEQQI